MRHLLRQFLPPIAYSAVERFRHGAKRIEYAPEGWERAEASVRGFEVDTLLERQLSAWEAFKKALEGPGPLGLLTEDRTVSNLSLTGHNTIMTYAYVLALASRNKGHISMLDWGGALGHYYLLARALYPELEIDYHCKEIQSCSERGRALLPEARFHSEDSEYAGRTFDLVMASGSLQFAKDWEATVQTLGNAASDYLFITRLPVVTGSGAFVVVQRLSTSTGHDSTYLSWVLNREALIRAVTRCEGIRLVREFLVQTGDEIYNAPALNAVNGYLFKRC